MDSSALRIAVVDDNADIRETLSMVIQLLGHESAVCSTGELALECIARWQPHVALIDISLPGMSGFDVARRVCASTVGSSPMLIAMTGWGRDEDRARSREAGFHKHLVKPVDLPQLRALFDEVARGASPERVVSA